MDQEHGPFGTRAEAQLRYAAFCHAAETGVSGPPGEQLVHAPRSLEYNTMIDTLETTGVELGGYDLEVLARLARLLSPLDCAVLNSLFQRAARDTYHETVHIVNPDLAVQRPEPRQR
jgi:hypothetical protein